VELCNRENFEGGPLDGNLMVKDGDREKLHLNARTQLA
jgi:hypothetical protein